MGKKTNRQFWESAIGNKQGWLQYHNRLTELSISMIKWEGLPDTVDERFLELALFGDGMAVYFRDEDIGDLALRTMIGGKLNVYQVPMQRTAYASNGYRRQLNESNSVLIFNNYLRTPSKLDVEIFARRLWELDRIIDVNTKGQKTPIMIRCDEKQRLTLMNLYQKYEGNEPFIFADKSLDPSTFGVLETGAPFVADKIYDLKVKIWNEALTFLGISNINSVKKERLITDEVQRNLGATVANRYGRLEARRKAAHQINKMFGTKIEVDFREDFDINMFEPENNGITLNGCEYNE